MPRRFHLIHAVVLWLQFQTAFSMWCITEVSSSSEVWFSDGKPVSEPRGDGNSTSYRLIVNNHGFLDLTDITTPALQLLDANGSILSLKPSNATGLVKEIVAPAPTCVGLFLQLRDDSTFTLKLANAKSGTGLLPLSTASGKLKPLPDITKEDADFIDTMIAKKYIPYQKIPEAPGKTVEEIKALGQQFFPFSPYSFQLAMCLYDWTTASFARLVFMKVFEYTSIQPQPHPLDLNSIAEQIWTSNWPPYTPHDAVYMNSFMMQPADSLENVKTQLNAVVTDLRKLSDVQNKMVSAAVQSLPRTSFFQHPQLFSGQVDIYQMGLNHFGVEFLEYPGNKGPVDQELITDFASVLDTYVAAGKTITTKMVWSFTDSVKDALHYSNGILLVANSPPSVVWDTTSYVTPLSDDPAKTEYIFPPGSEFEVQSVERITMNGAQLVVITLQPKTKSKPVANTAVSEHVDRALPAALGTSEVVGIASAESSGLPHSSHKTSGRRCACVVHRGDS